MWGISRTGPHLNVLHKFSLQAFRLGMRFLTLMAKRKASSFTRFTIPTEAH